MSQQDDRAGAAGCHWITPAPTGGWFLALRVQPGARRTEIQGVAEGRLRLRLAAPPVEGKANEALVRWVAQRLGARLREVTLVSGETSRIKRLHVDCVLTSAELERRLLEGQGAAAGRGSDGP